MSPPSLDYLVTPRVLDSSHLWLCMLCPSSSTRMHQTDYTICWMCFLVILLTKRLCFTSYDPNLSWIQVSRNVISKRIHIIFATHHGSLLQFLFCHCFLTLWKVNHHLNLSWSMKDEVLQLKIRNKLPWGPSK